MWSSDPQIIELIKGERGLGFSILDYQVSESFLETIEMISLLVHFELNHNHTLHQLN